jgi:hypothetical protein
MAAAAMPAFIIRLNMKLVSARSSTARAIASLRPTFLEDAYFMGCPLRLVPSDNGERDDWFPISANFVLERTWANRQCVAFVRRLRQSFAALRSLRDDRISAAWQVASMSFGERCGQTAAIAHQRTW